MNMVIDSIKAHFSFIQDNRQSARIDYPLFDILFGGLCAVITEARGWTDI